MQEMTVVLGNVLKGELPDFLVLDSVSENRNGFGVFFCLTVVKYLSSNILLFVFCDLVTLCWV